MSSSNQKELPFRNELVVLNNIKIRVDILEEELTECKEPFKAHELDQIYRDVSTLVSDTELLRAKTYKEKEDFWKSRMKDFFETMKKSFID